MIKLIWSNFIIRLIIIKGLSLTLCVNNNLLKNVNAPRKSCQVRQNTCHFIIWNNLCRTSHSDTYALVFMLLCKFVCDGLNVRVTLQTHHALRRGKPVPSLTSLRLSNCLSFLLSIAIIDHEERRKREGKMTTEQRNGVSFFSPWQLSLRVIAVGFSFLSLSLSLSLSLFPLYVVAGPSWKAA